MKVPALTLTLLFSLSLMAQGLQPGFFKDEYKEMMLISVQTATDTSYTNKFDPPQHHEMIYRSQEMGLKNLWDLWINEDHNIAVISIRGTTPDAESWLLNFYAAMVPAQGQITWGEDQYFDYDLSANPRAAVHVGWLTGTGFLYKDIRPKLDSLYNTGIKDYLIVGHSQGGGIAYLLTAHLYSLQKSGKLAEDIRFKTYCSAAPKPGNLPFAHTYESLTQNGWGFNVVNAADWVPEVPFSVQTLDDFNPTNPFIHVDDIIAQQRFTDRIAMRHVYKKLDKPTRKAQANFEKFLGEMTQKLVEDQIPNLQVPEYAPTNNYVRTGIQIVLMPDEEYYTKFPEDSSKVFTHHIHSAYLYLNDQLDEPFYETTKKSYRGLNYVDLTGRWYLSSIRGFQLNKENYLNGLPYIEIDMDKKRFTGYSGCNRINGTIELKDKTLKITNVVSTKMACIPKVKERPFLEALEGEFSMILVIGNPKGLILAKGEDVILEFEGATE